MYVYMYLTLLCTYIPQCGYVYPNVIGTCISQYSGTCIYMYVVYMYIRVYHSVGYMYPTAYVSHIVGHTYPTVKGMCIPQCGVHSTCYVYP